MNKICTSIEQSKKLIGLGIDVDTADMFYADLLVDDIHKYNLHPLESYGFKTFGETKLKTSDHLGFIPAWSLTALLELLPKLYEFEIDPYDSGCQPNLCKGWNSNLWYVVYRSTIYITEWYKDPVDAAFEMVCWLLENKKI